MSREFILRSRTDAEIECTLTFTEKVSEEKIARSKKIAELLFGNDSIWEETTEPDDRGR